MSSIKIDPQTGEIYEAPEWAKTPSSHGVVIPFIRTPYNYNMDAASEETGLHCPDDSLAQQHAKEDADINTIVQRFGLTGEVPVLQRQPLEGDFHEITDFHTAMIRIKEAQDQFMELPAQMRRDFNNDPGEFLAFATNKDNLPKLREMGLAKPEPIAAEPLAVRVVDAAKQDAPGKGDPVT